MSKQLKVAIVGAGRMGREHARAFAALGGVSVVGIQSRTRARAEALAKELGISEVRDSVDELWSATRADLVVVAVPELAAQEVARACFAHPWAVLLEKPAGYDLDDAGAILEACRGREAPVLVGLNRRFYSSLRTARADLDERPDEARFIHVQDQQSYAEARAHDHPEPVVEKFMYANSIHNIDLLRAFGRGAITRVTPLAPWRGEATEVVVAHVEFDSGDSGVYEGIWKGPGPWACAVTTPSVRWELRPLETAAYQPAGERRLHPVEIDPSDSEFKAGFLRQAEAVVARVRGERSDAVSLDDGFETMKLIHAIFGV